MPPGNPTSSRSAPNGTIVQKCASKTLVSSWCYTRKLTHMDFGRNGFLVYHACLVNLFWSPLQLLGHTPSCNFFWYHLVHACLPNTMSHSAPDDNLDWAKNGFWNLVVSSMQNLPTKPRDPRREGQPLITPELVRSSRRPPEHDIVGLGDLQGVSLE